MGLTATVPVIQTAAAAVTAAVVALPDLPDLTHAGYEDDICSFQRVDLSLHITAKDISDALLDVSNVRLVCPAALPAAAAALSASLLQIALRINSPTASDPSHSYRTQLKGLHDKFASASKVPDYVEVAAKAKALCVAARRGATRQANQQQVRTSSLSEVFGGLIGALGTVRGSSHIYQQAGAAAGV